MTRATKIDIQTSSDDMNHLWGEVDKVRTATPTVKVDKEVLTRLLLDHHKLLNHYEKG